MKVPAFIPAFFICLGAGAIVGVVLMLVTGYEHKPYAFVPGEKAPSLEGKVMAPPGMAKGGDGKGGGKGKGKGSGPGFESQTPSAKAQLAQLIAALDRIADHPPAITAGDAERKEFLRGLEGLDQLEGMDDQTVRLRLGQLFRSKLWEQNKETVLAAGYVAPGAGMPFGGGNNASDPAQHSKHVKSLQEKLSKSKAS